ncbi:ArsR/SmtB family transcription factor [Arthrobacter mobilis]|uniref:Winged helix-turn-helix transcriptional regulator n=1 Tax=Arthrobacter mobilis TaxID=2724944 RepID=A0A7X6HAD4_9MICC|nr:metalloregulator ArsR/SmtB family transcription factor [Arthrobacter mobilis]NKX53426.1 winged helix-turn-helix transcriptional regulator [Arthrobacter mobilis]
MVVDDVFAVIAESTRREILQSLRESDKAVGELVEELEVSQPTVSKHLKVLREAGLVSMRAQGQKRFYSLVAAPLEDVAEWVSAFGLGNGAAAGTAGRLEAPAGSVPAAEDAVLPAAVVLPGSAAAQTAAEAGQLPGGDRLSPAGRARTLGQAADRAANKAANKAADFLAHLSKPNLTNLPPLRRRKKN